MIACKIQRKNEKDHMALTSYVESTEIRILFLKNSGQQLPDSERLL